MGVPALEMIVLPRLLIPCGVGSGPTFKQQRKTLFRGVSSPRGMGSSRPLLHQAASADEVDLFVLSPDCVDFTRRRHVRSDEVATSGAASAASKRGVFRRGRAKVVVVEHVDEPDDGKGALTDLLLREISCYSCCSQAIDSQLQAGVPVISLSRRFRVETRSF